MEREDYKDERPEKRPETSRDLLQKEEKEDRDSRSVSSASCRSVDTKKGHRTSALHLGTQKMSIEKKVRKRRPVGRVEKRRRTGRVQRRPALRPKRMRAHSASTEESRHSGTPPPKCKYCGHRCCMSRNKRRGYENKTPKANPDGKSSSQRRASKKNILSECSQVGSRCKMLSPLFLGTNAAPQEPSAETRMYCEVTLEGPYCETCEVRFVSDEAHARHLKLSSRHSSDSDPFPKKEEMKEKWIKILGRPQELVDLFKKYHLVEFLTSIFSSEDFFPK